jgi:rhamnosyltransferase
MSNPNDPVDASLDGRARVPRVLVLMATYNGAPWVEEQLESIFAQRGVEVAVLVHDDRSTDKTAAIVRTLAERHAGLSLEIRETSSGSAGANFRGLFSTASFDGWDFVALADQDDLWEPDHLLRGCLALQARPRAGGYSCAVQTFGAGPSRRLGQAARQRRLDFLFEGAGQGCTFVVCMPTARQMQEVCRDASSRAQAMHYHDWLLYLIVRVGGRDWIFDDRVSLRYRQHGANEIGARSGAGAVRRRLALIRKGWYGEQVRSALALAVDLAPPSAAILQFQAVFCAKQSLARRWRLAALLLRNGRRRGIDRIVLGCAALAGWL